ncbi:MAG: MBL fold metallo-hydrolase [Actinomycetota bacterium]
MNVTLWGTRGSVPTPGPQTVRYGGNTSCVEVRGCPDSIVVLDAGTGIRALGRSLGPDVRRVDILLTHLHLDHIQGLGFFDPLSRPGLEVHLWGPASTVRTLGARLSRYLSPPLFPVRLRDRRCDLTLHAVQPGSFALPGFEVSADLVRHRGRTVGYRLSHGHGSLAYLPDHELKPGRASQSGGRPVSGHALVRGVDLLIHDAQYSVDEYLEHAGWGHSSIDEAINFAASADVGTLVAFHHDPAHDDRAIDGILESALRDRERGPEIVAAIEGSTFTVGPTARELAPTTIAHAARRCRSSAVVPWAS